MDVQALAPVASALSLTDSAQSQSSPAIPPSPLVSAAGSSSAKTPSPSPLQSVDQAPKTATQETSAAQPVSISPVHAAYKYLTNPVQVVIVFSDADGQVVSQSPPQSLVQLVKFDHAPGELVDRDA
jgi:hypothetical protein